MVWNELIQLVENIITQTKTIKSVAILAMVFFLMSSLGLSALFAAVLFIERQSLIDLVRAEHTLKVRFNEEDKSTLRLFQKTYVRSIDSVHMVWYDKASRTIEVLYSYPRVPPGFDVARPYSLDFDIHSEHHKLKCVTRPINNDNMSEVVIRSSCPVYHSNPYGVEGYVMVLLNPDNTIPTDEIELYIGDIARTIGD